MATRLRKSRKLRGHVSAGHGRVGKHRKHPGGRGKAGGLAHQRNHFDRYHPGYFGKVGQRQLHLNKHARFTPTCNVEALWPLIPRELYENTKKNPQGEVPVLDCAQHGIFKVLGGGHLPCVPLIVKARFFSKRAEQKIIAAGGVCELSA